MFFIINYNLTEWQDSAGTVIASVSPSGAFISNSSFLTGGTLRGTGSLIVGGTTAISSVRASIYTNSTTTVGLAIQGAASQTANLQEWQTSAGTVIGSMSSTGTINSTNLGTLNNWVYAKEEQSGGQMRLKKTSGAAANNRATDFAQLYLRDGTNAGTLKLVIIAGTTGAETTILDNIPQ